MASATIDSATSIHIAGFAAWVISAAFSPDGTRVLITTGDGTARIWRADGSGTPIVLTGQHDMANPATFSPDGSLVLTASADGTVRIWSVDDQAHPLILRHEELSKSLSKALFLPDGSCVVTLSKDGVVRIWPITPSLLRNSLRNATTMCLSVNERERYLLESHDEALEGHERCERAHNRIP
jgi:WD40 repeat protein